MKAIDIGLIQARRAKIGEEIARHQQAIADHQEAIALFETKLNELGIAERVFAELSLESDYVSYANTVDTAAAIEMTVSRRSDEEHEKGIEPAGKPGGIPSVPEMIIEALNHARGLGAPGLKPKGLTSYIRGRYWPNAPDMAVGPIAWRMWKRGELGKQGSTYVLPTSAQSNEIDATTSEEPQGQGDPETQPLHNSSYGKEPMLFQRSTSLPGAP